MSINTAIIFFDSSGNNTISKWCKREIASIPIYKHIILSASKAGITKFLFVGCSLREEIESFIRVERQIKCDFVWYKREENTHLDTVIDEEISKDELFFIIKANCFFDYRILHMLSRVPLDDKIASVITDQNLQTFEERAGNSNSAATNVQNSVRGGIIAASPKILPILTPHNGDLSFQTLIELLHAGNLLKTVQIKEYLHKEIDSEESLVSSEKKLYQSLGSSSDSPILDTFVIRKISRFISTLFLRTPVTPNQVTITSLLLGLLSGFLFSFGEFTYGIFAGVLYFLSVIFDQCDGEIARLKYMQSESGKILDIITDTVVNAAIVAGITCGIYKNNGSGFIIVLGLLAMLGISVSLLLTTFFEKKEGQNGSTDEFFDKLNNKDFFYIIIILCIFINQMIWFLWVMAIGTNIYWISLKVVHPIRRLMTFVFSKGKI